MLAHIHPSRAYLLAIVAQLAALVGGFGVVDNVTVGVWATAAAAIVNAAFLIANAIHATGQRQPNVVIAPPAPPPAGGQIAPAGGDLPAHN